MNKERKLDLSKEEVSMLCTQISCRCDELDTYIKDKASRGQNFDGTYELKKSLQSVLERLYKIL